MSATDRTGRRLTMCRIIVGMVLGSASPPRQRHDAVRQHPGQTRIYPIPLGWEVFVLISIVPRWWFEFYLSQDRDVRFLHLSVGDRRRDDLRALAALLFPDRMSEYAGYEDYFESAQALVLRPSRLSCVLDLGDTMIKAATISPARAGISLSTGAFIVAAVAAMFIPGKPYQALFSRRRHGLRDSWIFRMLQRPGLIRTGDAAQGMSVGGIGGRAA